MNKPLVYSTLAVATVGAVVLAPVAAGAVANRYGGNEAAGQTVQARDGSGDATQDRIHTDTEKRLYVHQEDGDCDGTGPADGTGEGYGYGNGDGTGDCTGDGTGEQRQYGRQ